MQEQRQENDILASILKRKLGSHQVIVGITELYCWGGGTSSLKHISGSLSTKQVRQVACGGSHVICLTKTGEVYCWGQNSSGQLGLPYLTSPNNDLGSAVRESDNPILVFSVSSAKKIVAGPAQSALIDNKGILYLWGLLPSGPAYRPVIASTGILAPSTKPRMIRKSKAMFGTFLDFSSVAKFEKASSSSMFMNIEQKQSNDHAVMIKGCVTDVCFGISHITVVSVSPDSRKTRKVEHSNKAGFSQDVWAWGSSGKGLLGTGEEATEYKDAVRVHSLCGKDIVQVASGETHMAALSADGKVYMWGENTDKVLGLGVPDAIVSTPTILGKLKNEIITQIYLGFKYSLCVTKEGKLYSWGRGRHGCLGLGFEEVVSEPTLCRYFDGNKINMMACGGTHSVCYCDNENIYSWGEGRNYKLGHPDCEDRLKPTLVNQDLPKKPLLQMACGFDKSFCLIERQIIDVFYKNKMKQLSVEGFETVEELAGCIKNGFKILPGWNISFTDEQGEIIPNSGKIDILDGIMKLFVVSPEMIEPKFNKPEVEIELSIDSNGNEKCAIKKGTCMGLLAYFTKTYMDEKCSISAFLTTFQLMKVDASMFCDMLIKWYEIHPLTLQHIAKLHPSIEPFLRDRDRVKARTLNILIEWLQEYPEDVTMLPTGELVLNQISRFLEGHPLSHFLVLANRALQVVFKLQQHIVEKCTGLVGKTDDFAHYPVNIAWESPIQSTFSSTNDLFNYPAIDIAKNLCLVDFHDYYKHLAFKELIWLKLELLQNPIFDSLLSLLRRFKQITRWIEIEVLDCASVELRQKKVEKLIEIARECFKLRNMQAVCGICIALNGKSIKRLRSLWAGGEFSVSNDLQSELSHLTNSSLDIQKYAEIFASSEEPKIPFVGHLLEEFEQILNENPIFDDELEITANFVHLQNIATWLTKMGKSTEEPYKINGTVGIVQHLRKPLIDTEYQDTLVLSEVLEKDGLPGIEDSSIQHIHQKVKEWEAKCTGRGEMEGGRLSEQAQRLVAVQWELKHCAQGEPPQPPLPPSTHSSPSLSPSAFDHCRSNLFQVWADGLDNNTIMAIRCPRASTIIGDVHIYFKDVFQESDCFEYFIQSLLISFPQDAKTKLNIQKICKHVLCSNIDTNSIVEGLAELSNYNLSCSFTKSIASLLSSYKRVSLSRLEGQRKTTQSIMTQLVNKKELPHEVQAFGTILKGFLSQLDVAADLQFCYESKLEIVQEEYQLRKENNSAITWSEDEQTLLKNLSNMSATVETVLQGFMQEKMNIDILKQKFDETFKSRELQLHYEMHSLQQEELMLRNKLAQVRTKLDITEACLLSTKSQGNVVASYFDSNIAKIQAATANTKKSASHVQPKKLVDQLESMHTKIMASAAAEEETALNELQIAAEEFLFAIDKQLDMHQQLLDIIQQRTVNRSFDTTTDASASPTLRRIDSMKGDEIEDAYCLRKCETVLHQTKRAIGIHVAPISFTQDKIKDLPQSIQRVLQRIQKLERQRHRLYSFVSTSVSKSSEENPPEPPQQKEELAVPQIQVPPGTPKMHAPSRPKK